MFYTYVLLCFDSARNRRKLYVGSTENISHRVEEHKARAVQTTKSFDTVELIYYETCLNKTDARKRELQLKTGFGRGYLKKRLENYLRERV